MDIADIYSSDEDNPTTPVCRKRSTRSNRKVVNYCLQISSDSEGETPHKKDEKMLGEISLLTSDEDYVSDTPPPPKKRPRKAAATKVKKAIKTIDLMSSDDDDGIKAKSHQPAVRRKRKLEEPGDGEETSPPKRARSAGKLKVPVQKKVTHVAAKKSPRVAAKKSPCVAAKKSPRVAAKKIPAEMNVKKRVSIPSPNASLDNIRVDVKPTWTPSELLAEKTMIDEDVVRDLIKLWEEGNTIPFIARYRKNVIGDMTPEDLRTTKETYDEICVLQKKITTVVKAVTQLGKLDEKLQGNICAVKTLEELEHIYAPFKADHKGSLADRAKRCGLQEPAMHLLNNTSRINTVDYVKPAVKDIKTVEDVEKGIIHIIASEIATDSELLTILRDLRAKAWFRLRTKKARQVKAKENTLVDNKKTAFKKDPKLEEAKFETYFDFNQRVDYLKPHQILAINRGETLKILSVKIEIPEWLEKQFKYFCSKKWSCEKISDPNRTKIINSSIEDAYQRLIFPLITREIRAELKQKAEKESCKVFSDNLKHMLLTRPMKGKSILGIDPGFSNGCKLALISATGSLLAKNVIYPHSTKTGNKGEAVIKDLLLRHNCNLIGIGNGTACRETEEWISDLIMKHYFNGLDVQYTIVNEDGASIYSCSAEARKEFGTLDPNIISAVSLARRIQDPMAELVKVEPCHLGIGMYQLDIKKKQLEEALDEVLSETVSFVGVDLNTASQCLLRRVAGLSDKKATQIIDHRVRNGPFFHRRQLLEVFGIGERIFEQCAGFLRVGPTDPNDVNFYKRKYTTPLDATIIHPESYPIVREILRKMNLKEKDVGSESFIRTFLVCSKQQNVENLSSTFQTDKQTIQLIFDALSKTLNHDLRTEISKTPLFKKDVTSMENLEIGSMLTGRVKNVTSFGAFVDIGVKRDGLVHNKFMKGLTLHLGDVVEVKLINVDKVKGYIQLESVRKLK